MDVTNRTIATLPLLMALSLVTPETHPALSSEFLPIHIEADRAEIDEGDGTAVYSGNVFVSQGAVSITADQIRILTAGDEIVQIVASVASGSPRLAHYEQKRDAQRDPVYADAREIIYRVREEMLELSGDAHLQQMTDTFSGELLRYDVRQGTVSLTGSSGADEERPGRISISITPPTESEDAPKK